MPKNMAPLALVAGNIVMTFLDLISAVAVGVLTNWLYGVLTFFAGVAALFVWERLYTNAHARVMQKVIAVVGIVLSVGATLGVGVASALVNVLGVAGLVNPAYLSAGMIIFLVVVSFIHGIAWGVYYFSDPTHVAEMKRMVNMAFREQQKQGLEDAKEDVAAVLAMEAQIEQYEKSGQLDYLSAAFEEVRGVSLVQPQIAVDPAVGFVPKAVPSPLSDDGEPNS